MKITLTNPTVTIRSFDKGLLYRNGDFQAVLNPGTHWVFDPMHAVQVDIVSQRDPWLVRDDLDVLIASGKLRDDLLVINLADTQRALVWVDGRFSKVLSPGLYAAWKSPRTVQVEVIDVDDVRFTHPQLPTIINTPGSSAALDAIFVNEHYLGVLFVNGAYVDTLPPGQYAFWRYCATVRVEQLDTRTQLLDVAGQEIMTGDKVTLRLNAVVTYRVANALQAVSATDTVKQALYREAQLALRAAIGTRELDALLGDKDAMAGELESAVRESVRSFGLEVISLGIRDIILPGEMKDLLNKVTEAKKAAEANLIARREETAAMRNQANTARLLAENPTLMRLRELEVLEKVADKAKLTVVLGEHGLTDRVVNLL